MYLGNIVKKSFDVNVCMSALMQDVVCISCMFLLVVR